ncbi:DUF3000 domain-containing protein [Granulicoccus sp. GXG6511]|uniref:DUF3000 domain-containing protein n=1 Tax=Granulicoccus sp. GXG6511 TaxID=3381351 RepID=UPI003D7D8FBD
METSALPPSFAKTLQELSAHVWRPELSIDEIPAPQRIAPFAAAITADVMSEDLELGNGRLVLLHDPAGNDSWDGDFRLVSFARADVEPELVADPLLPEVGWSWLTDALERQGADYTAPSGTVTSVASQSFGSLESEPARAEVEIRASWTPLLRDGEGLSAHLSAWDHLLCSLAGLPPLPEGVVMIPSARRARGR